MFNNTTEKLVSIQTKIDTINERLEAGRLYSISSSDSVSVFERTRSLFRLAMERQSFYAHFFKLMALFCIAVAHLIYLQSFMDSYSILEDYTFKLHARYAPSSHPTTTIPPQLKLLEELSLTATSPKDPLDAGSLDEFQLQDFNAMSNQMALLSDYRRNNWMCVAVRLADRVSNILITSGNVCFSLHLLVLPLHLANHRSLSTQRIDYGYYRSGFVFCHSTSLDYSDLHRRGFGILVGPGVAWSS